MTYKYETHLHTSEASACATTKAADYIEAYKAAGYSGIFVTDHFFGGNTCVDRELSWENRIELYCKGYENALLAAKQSGNFSVFFGIEQTFDGDDYLLYGLDKNWLIKHPEIEFMNHKETFDAVNSVGGLMIQAHPFRLRNYIKAIHLHPREVHGVEIYNAGNRIEENQQAELYAKIYDFPVTSGSDIHNVDFILNRQDKMPIGGIEFEKKLNSIEDYIQSIKNKEGKIIK